jgi:predicted transposase YdaD
VRTDAIFYQLFKRFPSFRQEVEAMIGVRLEETRVYQEAKADGKAEGKAEDIAEGKAIGKAEGQLEEGRSLILRQLQRRVGELTPVVRSQIQTLDQLESLGEALLDFMGVEDLDQWLPMAHSLISCGFLVRSHHFLAHSRTACRIALRPLARWASIK